MSRRLIEKSPTVGGLNLRDPPRIDSTMQNAITLDERQI